MMDDVRSTINPGPNGIVSWKVWMEIPEQRLENWLDIPNSVLLFFLRSLRTSRLKMRTPGIAEDTMDATMDPRLATPEP